MSAPEEPPRLILTESAFVAAVLVGMSSEHDPVPTQEQMDRVLNLAREASERLNEEALTRLLRVVLGETSPAQCPCGLPGHGPDGPTPEDTSSCASWPQGRL